MLVCVFGVYVVCVFIVCGLVCVLVCICVGVCVCVVVCFGVYV